VIQYDWIWFLHSSIRHDWRCKTSSIQTACHFNFLNGMVLHMVVRDLHTNISLSQVSELLTRPRTQSERIWAWSCWTPSKQVVFANSVRLLSFQLQHLRIFLQKIPSIWMQREGPTVQESCKINMNVGLAPHLATSKLKILRGLCQGSRGSIHDPQLFQIWVSSTVNPIHQKASVSS